MTAEPVTCSAISALDEPLPGTAAHTTGWLCIEHPGAWGRDVVKNAVLGESLSVELGRRTADAGVRLMLIRRPGRTERPAQRTVLLANSQPGASWCERLEISDLDELLDVDLHAISGAAPGIGSVTTESEILVCAHGKRDQCCARLGRPIAARLAAAGSVWECSHTGGHRFAPSMIVLPTGYSYGRLNIEESIDVVSAFRRDEVPTTGLRGRSSYGPIGQAAEVAVRERISAGVEDLSVIENPSSAVVSHRDGRQWNVQLDTITLPPRPASCGAAAKSVKSVRVESVDSVHH